MSGLFGGLYARGPVAAEVSDRAWLQAMLDVEWALGGPHLAAETFDVDALGAAGAEHASVVVPLAERFAGTHAGATSQDIIDTAMMLISARARNALCGDLHAAIRAAAVLVERHRDVPVLGRTLLQAARPTTVGLVCAGWATGLAEATRALAAVTLPAQMGGPVGTRDPAVALAIAERLGLEVPVIAWHTDRVRPAQLAAALGVLAGALAKPARDVTLSPYLVEGVPGRGGSSAMPEKQNPVAAVSTLACTRRVPGLVATLLATMEQEHQRAAGAWQAEWGTLSDLLRLCGSAAAWTRDLLEHLRFDPTAGAAGLPEHPDVGFASALIDRALAALADFTTTPGPTQPPTRQEDDR